MLRRYADLHEPPVPNAIAMQKAEGLSDFNRHSCSARLTIHSLDRPASIALAAHFGTGSVQH
jgi:hypothetical protein